jgi:hypothetical protein
LQQPERPACSIINLTSVGNAKAGCFAWPKLIEVIKQLEQELVQASEKRRLL